MTIKFKSKLTKWADHWVLGPDDVVNNEQTFQVYCARVLGTVKMRQSMRPRVDGSGYAAETQAIRREMAIPVSLVRVRLAGSALASAAAGPGRALFDIDQTNTGGPFRCSLVKVIWASVCSRRRSGNNASEREAWGSLLRARGAPVSRLTCMRYLDQVTYPQHPPVGMARFSAALRCTAVPTCTVGSIPQWLFLLHGVGIEVGLMKSITQV